MYMFVKSYAMRLMQGFASAVFFKGILLDISDVYNVRSYMLHDGSN